MDPCRLYFSSANVETIQKSIKTRVLKLSGAIIPRQNDVSVRGVMHYHWTNGIATALGEYYHDEKVEMYRKALLSLNDKVVKECSNRIITGMQEQAFYLQDINAPETLQGRPSLSNQ